MAEFIVYQDRAGAWRWHMWAPGNREIVAVSSEGYVSSANAERAALWVKTNAANAPIRRV